MDCFVYMVGAGEIARRRLRFTSSGDREEHQTVAAREDSPSASVRALPSAHDPSTIVVVMAGIISRSDARRLADRVNELLAGRPATKLICHLAGIGRSDAAVVDALCRIRVAARRHGCQVAIQEPSTALRELLCLTGLTNVLPSATESVDAPGGNGSRRGSERQPE